MVLDVCEVRAVYSGVNACGGYEAGLKRTFTLFGSKRFSLLCCLCIIGGHFQKSSQMFLINSASDCQVMNKIQMINPFLAFNSIFFNVNIFLPTI